MHANTKQQTLVVSCPDSAGIVVAVSGFIAERGGLLVEANHLTDLQQSWFYMRNVIDMRNSDVSFSSFKAQFQEIVEAFQMQWSLRSANTRQKVVILASRLTHCLADLMHDWQDGDLIGATCHYVTEGLDEGPIIEQDVIRAGHNCDRQEMIRRGRDVEKRVLARGLRSHLEDRVLARGNEADVFS